MNKQKNLHKNRFGLAVAFVVFILAMGAWALHGYYAAKQSLAALDVQRTKLARLKTEIKTTQDSIDRLKAEQEEFKKLLFNDRDVPAFIDGISHFAAKSKVRIMDMKTQRFSQIVVPKSFSDASKMENRGIIVDTDNEYKPDPQVEFKNRLTLAAMPIHMKIKGTFAAIVFFLNSIENDRQLLTVSNVEITRNTQDYPQLDCDFILKIYSLELLKDIKT
jgi:Tfp pilus assembly protein PilO